MGFVGTSYFILNTLTEIVGGFFLTTAFVISIFCVLNALLLFADEYRVVFTRIMRSCGIVIAIFGLVLPFRQDVHPFATIVSLWWAALFNDFIPYFQLIQFIALDLSSWIYWCFYLSKVKKDELIFMLKIGDFSIFVVLPTVFGLVMVSKSSISLDGDYKSLRKSQTMNYQIPLRSIISKASSLLEKIVPSN